MPNRERYCRTFVKILRETDAEKHIKNFEKLMQKIDTGGEEP